MGVPGHQDAIPTLVEVKRSTDTRIRREVVAQMLDYAANSVVYLSVERIRNLFENYWQQSEQSPDSVLDEFLEGTDPEEFWQQVKTNLQAGKIRLLFVADKIPTELRRIVEFLNIQMDPAEVLAVEVRQYAGGEIKSLVPRVIGQTAEAQSKKRTSTKTRRKWDQEQFIADLRERHGKPTVQVALKILDWAECHELRRGSRENADGTPMLLEGLARQSSWHSDWANKQGLRIWWGEGAKDGSFFPMLDHKGFTNWTISVWTYGRIEIQFQYLKEKPPFNDESKRLELLEKLNEIEGVNLPVDSITRRPSIKISDLINESAFIKFRSAMDWVIQKIATQLD